MQTETVQWEAVRTIYDRLLEAQEEEKPDELIPSLTSIFGDQSEEIVPFEKIGLYADRLGASLAKSPGGHAFFNGKHFDVNDVSGFIFCLFVFALKCR